jgi:hypothetical protein
VVAAGVTLLVQSTGDGRDGLRLEVYDHGTKQIVHTRMVEPGEMFRMRHTHSVTRRPVFETFSVTAEGIAMEELWFDDFGPNLPAGPEDIGGTRTTFLIENGAFRVLHHGRLLPTVPLRVGSPSVEHVLTFADGTRLRLLDVAAPAAYLELRVTAG